jgi:hypothetical protein
VSRALPVRKEFRVRQVLPAPKGRRDHREYRASKDQLVQLERRGRLEKRVPWVPLARRVSKAFRVRLARKGPLDRRETKAFKVRLVLRAM